jgi:carbonic anhydrase
MKTRWVLVMMAGCGGAAVPSAPAPTAMPTGTTAPPALTASATHAAWSYSGDTGPARWGELDASFAACKTGGAQSPVDLPAAPSRRQGALGRPHWEPVPLKVTNTGHSIQVDDAASSSLVMDGTTYKLAQFHFHSPAEHTVAGRSYDVEMHLVHKAEGGKLAVVALLFGTGTENALLAPVWSAMPAQPGPPVDVPAATIDVAALLPAAPRYLRYAGSLTSPPCTEGVTWLVVEPDGATQLSAEQVRKLRQSTQPATNRPVQLLGGREVIELGS